jgi:hypothetical protein
MSYRFEAPPAALRRVRRDNLALVPGDLLPYRRAWQEAANSLPAGAVLIVFPANNSRQKHALLAVAKMLGQEGRQVSLQSAEAFRHA